MTGHLYIDDVKIGEVKLKIIDESMGGIGGILIPNSAYENYRTQIQNLWDKNGIANVSNFNFKIILENKITIRPEGGIGVTDMPGDNEIYVESAGADASIIMMLSQ